MKTGYAHRIVGVAILLLSLLAFLAGCGGGANSVAAGGSSGRAVFTVKWPDRSRLIPVASNSIKVLIRFSSDYSLVQVLPRPATGNTSTVTFNDVKPGAFDMFAGAYPNADGTGVAQASGNAHITVVANQTTNVNLTMDSTIHNLDVTPFSHYRFVVAGSDRQLIVTPRDINNGIVLTAPGRITFTPSSSDVTVDANGMIHAVRPGHPTITITETETGKQTVVTIDISPLLQPNAIYVLDDTNQIIRSADMRGTNWALYGGTGSGVGQFNGPAGLAFDGTGRIYVADRYNNRIVRINDMTGAGWISFGTRGSGQGQFSDPTGIAVDGAGHIYVSDYSNHRIVKIDDMTGAGWATLGSPQFSISGPTGIITDSANRVYIADAPGHHIVRTDDINGTNYISLGTPGTHDGQFGGPISIALDNAGRIYVSDVDLVNQVSRIIHVDDMTGTNWVSSTGGYSCIALNSSNRLYLAGGFILSQGEILGSQYDGVGYLVNARFVTIH